MRYIWIVMLVLGAISCTTFDKIHRDEDLDSAKLTGKIINEEGLPLEGAKVLLNGTHDCRSDINGRFLFNTLKIGDNVLTISKKEYTGAELHVTYSLKDKKGYIVKVKLFSLNYLLDEGYALLEEKKFNEVETVLTSIKSIDEDNYAFRYLQAVYQKERGNYETAVDILEKLRNEDRNNEYFTLTLIELYDLLKWYRKEAQICEVLSLSNQDKYGALLNRAALLYKEQLDDLDNYQRIMTLQQGVQQAP